MFEGSFEVKHPSKDILKSNFRRYGQMKSRDGKSQRREEKRREEKVIRKKMQERKSRKVAKQSVFPVICASEGSTNRPTKAADPEPSGQMRDEKL